jgi:hypothetical protein
VITFAAKENLSFPSLSGFIFCRNKKEFHQILKSLTQEFSLWPIVEERGRMQEGKKGGSGKYPGGGGRVGGAVKGGGGRKGPRHQI